MGRELLEWVLELLGRGGIPAGEAWPGARRPEPEEALAAVGLRELDCAKGVARIAVDILSPRRLGGWHCQLRAADAVRLLHGAGFTCETGEMEYLPESDCFRVPVTARLPVEPGAEGWSVAGEWEILCGNVRQEGVLSFRAVLDRGRRLVGSMAQAEAVGVTSAAGGWTIELIQADVPEPTEETEPFVLTLRRGVWTEQFRGCYWNETITEYAGVGRRLIRRGFALTREVLEDG